MRKKHVHTHNGQVDQWMGEKEPFGLDTGITRVAGTLALGPLVAIMRATLLTRTNKRVREMNK